MLIRVNVHLDKSWLKRLDEIKDGFWEFGGKSWRLRDLTRADLIRFAVAQVFGFKYPYVHVGGEFIAANLKKVLKELGSKKGV